MENNKKARGFYGKFNDELRTLYDNMMEKSFIDDLEKLNKKELAYLSDLYERKVKELKPLHKEQLEEKDVLAIVISIKLKAAIARKKMNINEYRYAKKHELTTQQKQKARNKLYHIVK